MVHQLPSKRSRKRGLLSAVDIVLCMCDSAFQMRDSVKRALEMLGEHSLFLDGHERNGPAEHAIRRQVEDAYAGRHACESPELGIGEKRCVQPLARDVR